MDSRLMNIMYDDAFDGNYIKYDNNAGFWSSVSDTMGMQLTETLHGILPIAPTTDDFRTDEIVTTNTINSHNHTKLFNYGGFAENHFAAGGAIELLTVDANADIFDTDSEDDDSNDIDEDNNLMISGRISQSSSFTFRTRTDSSSIGDYESSHTSDYDEDETENDVGIIAKDNLTLPSEAYQKCRTISTNTFGSDCDGLDLSIDANTFDLAEFITKDDFPMFIGSENNKKISKTPCAINSKNILLNNNPSHTDSDSDSDVIVDVETVCEDEGNINSFIQSSELLEPEVKPNLQADVLPYVDNVTYDPSWSSNQSEIKLEATTGTPTGSLTKKFTIVPNKKQCDILKGKFAKGKTKPMQKAIKDMKKKLKESLPQINEAKHLLDRKTGVGMGGKNLALLKHDCRVSISPKSSEESGSPIKCPIKLEQQSPTITSTTPFKEEKTPAQNTLSATQTVKRKLNLDEYKMRRNDLPNFEKNSSDSHNVLNLENKTQMCSNARNPITAAIASVNHSKEVTSIVKSLKEQQQQQVKTSATDPITEAKNKVLRMQELKKAQQLRIIDSTISAKVPKVTKLLPLREIVKDTPYGVCDVNLNKSKCNPDYEEIIIVSVSSNTEISLPPVLDKSTSAVNTVTRSLLKSTALLTSVSDALEKAKASDNLKISANSLIASIQNVVVKNPHTVEVEATSNKTCELKDPAINEHGEDKTIMHLRKDRIRKKTFTIGTQTVMQAEFPPLQKLKPDYKHKSRDRERLEKCKRRQYRKHKEQSSSDSENSSGNQSNHSRSSSLSRSHDSSRASSVERIRVYDSAIGTGSYSSRSSRKHSSSICSSNSGSIDRVARGRKQLRTSFKHRSKRSQSPRSSSSYTSDSDRSRSPLRRRSRSRSISSSRNRRNRRTSYRQNNKNFVDRNVSQPAVEERRIVYVGRIEPETTKDIIRRKFLPYGTIKQISIHTKDTGMKYGFVTFERSQDAFNAIDNCTRDPKISMYDISFGGRRAFCRASYADLDNAGVNTYQSIVYPQKTQQPKEEDSFEALLLKMKAKLNANKKTNSSTSTNKETGVGENIKPNTNCTK